MTNTDGLLIPPMAYVRVSVYSLLLFLYPGQTARQCAVVPSKHQEEYRELCGNCYHESDYIYVNDIGEQIKPNYVTQHFKLVLRKNNLREITFHELRHTCASLLLKSGISMKDIQAWLGHSNYNTTANIYAHLESNSKELTGNAMQGNLTISGNLAAMQE